MGAGNSTSYDDRDNRYNRDDRNNSRQSKRKPKPAYDCDQVWIIRNIYILGIVFWVLLIFILGIFPTCDFVGFLIILLPIIVFLIAWKSIPYITDHVDTYMFRANLLTLGLLIALPILTWVYTHSKHNRTMFIKLLIVAIIFSVLTLVDVWVPHKFLPVERHVQSILQTFALTIFIFALYQYFIERRDRDRNKTYHELKTGKSKNVGVQDDWNPTSGSFLNSNDIRA